MLFRWWYKGKRVGNGSYGTPAFRFEGRVLAKDLATGAEAVERVMRERLPDVRWMHGRKTESGGDCRFGPTLQPCKTVYINHAWLPLEDGVFVLKQSLGIDHLCAGTRLQATDLLGATWTTGTQLPSDQSLAKEVIDRRMIGNMLVITLESYLHVCGLPGDELRTLIAKWRQIPGAR